MSRGKMVKQSLIISKLTNQKQYSIISYRKVPVNIRKIYVEFQNDNFVFYFKQSEKINIILKDLDPIYLKFELLFLKKNHFFKPFCTYIFYVDSTKEINELTIEDFYINSIKYQNIYNCKNRTLKSICESLGVKMFKKETSTIKEFLKIIDLEKYTFEIFAGDKTYFLKKEQEIKKNNMIELIENDIKQWIKQHKTFLKKSKVDDDNILEWLLNCFVLYFNKNKKVEDIKLEYNNFWFDKNINRTMFLNNQFIMQNIIIPNDFNKISILKHFIKILIKYNNDLKKQ